MDAERSNLIANLTRMWADAAGEPVAIEIHGDRVYGFTSELGALRIASEWQHPARNRYPDTSCYRGKGWAYSMDHLLRDCAA